MKDLRFYARVLFVATLLIGLWQFLFADRAVVHLQVETVQRSLFKIYWRGADQPWSSWRSTVAAATGRGKSTFEFRLTDLRRVSELRLDPLEKKGAVTVKSLTLHQDGCAPITLTAEAVEKLQVVRQVEGLTPLQGGGFTVTSTGNDPALIWKLPPLEPLANPGEQYVYQGVRIVLLLFFALLLVLAAGRLTPGWLFVPGGLLLVLTLVSVMAGISRYNEHPDEGVHAEAASYYMKYTLPPPVGDPRAEGTYSGYGVSRLYNGEVAYLFAGKFARLLTPLDLPDWLAFRAFNVSLLLMLVVLACRVTGFRPVLLPLLLSPQIWYIFSYWNSEAFALTLTMLAAWQLTAEESSWNRLLYSPGTRLLSVLRILAVGLLIGLLLLCKINFYFFPLFAGCFLLWLLCNRELQLDRRTLLRVGGVALVAVSLFGSARLFDAWNNDFNKAERMLEVREQHAQYAYKPSTPLEKKNHRLQLRDRGLPFSGLLERRWGEYSFRSSVGEYGHTSVPGSFNYYDLVRWLMMALGLAAVVSITMMGGMGGVTLLGITIFCPLLLMLAALYNSWTMDFQAQGRYFLPMLGMFSVLLCRQRRALSNVVTASLATLLFATALYSFIFVALAGTGKVTAPFN